jgi:CRP-like cAMP-binding protein
VRLASEDGVVTEVTWRATKLRTKAGNFVIVPNNMAAREPIINYSQPIVDTRIEVVVGAGYEASPGDVKATILDAIAHEPLMSRNHPPEVLIKDFADSAVMYRIRVWLTNFAADEQLADRIRSNVYYAFRRRGISIPYPHQVQLELPPDAYAVRRASSATIAAELARVEVFAPLSDAQRSDLAAVAKPCLFGAGEMIVRQGTAGQSMFVIVRGEASVTLTGATGELARLGSGSFFGEMSLLTGEPRTANVVAITECDLVELTSDDVRRVVLADPTIVDRVAGAVAARRVELEAHRATHGHASSAEESGSLIARAWRFLKLSPVGHRH